MATEYKFSCYHCNDAKDVPAEELHGLSVRGITHCSVAFLCKSCHKLLERMQMEFVRMGLERDYPKVTWI